MDAQLSFRVRCAPFEDGSDTGYGCAATGFTAVGDPDLVTFIDGNFKEL
jgi:hypothetical protein